MSRNPRASISTELSMPGGLPAYKSNVYQGPVTHINLPPTRARPRDDYGAQGSSYDQSSRRGSQGSQGSGGAGGSGGISGSGGMYDQPLTRSPRADNDEPAPRPNNRYSTYLGPAPSRPRAQAPCAHLVYLTQNGGGSIIPLNVEHPTNIGRKEDNDVVLSCAKISKYHAAIVRGEVDPESGKPFAPGWYWLRDCNSSNGVKLNEGYISQAAPLADGDRIQVGTIMLQFMYDDGPLASARSQSIVNQGGGGGGASAAPRSRNGPAAASSRAYDSASYSKPRYESYAGAYGGPSSRYSTANDYDDSRNSLADIRLVTILPSERKYEETVSIRAELDELRTTDFLPVQDIKDTNTLEQDYEKLRLAYELSKVSYTADVNAHLTKMIDMMFSVLPVDRGVVLLVDKATALLVTNMVKLREGKGYEGREILLSSTILQRVYRTRKSLITSDACEDPDLGKSKSIAKGQIRSVICVPLIAHEEVLGIVHLDSRDRINTFAEKDLSLVQTIINQTALQIENSTMFSELQNEIRVTEQLNRFLSPQVVDRMVKKEGMIRKGGREATGTIMFVDIRGFTALSEKATPTEVFNLLNDYFERLVTVVFKYSGVVDKFIGDALMAVFGTLDDIEADPTPHVLNSVHAAIECKAAIEEMNAERLVAGLQPVEIGVGLNTGRLMAGFMGSSQRLEYTCIGDSVNLASRICGFAGTNQVLISEETYRYVRSRFEARYVDTRQFKGKEQQTRVYEAISAINDGMIENASEISTHY